MNFGEHNFTHNEALLGFPRSYRRGWTKRRFYEFSVAESDFAQELKMEQNLPLHWSKESQSNRYSNAGSACTVHRSTQDSAPTCVQHPKASGKWHQQGSKLTEEGWELAGLGDSHILRVSSWAGRRPRTHGSLASLPCFVWCCFQLSSHRRCHSPSVPVRSFAGLTGASDLMEQWIGLWYRSKMLCPVTAGFEFCRWGSFLDGTVWRTASVLR